MYQSCGYLLTIEDKNEDKDHLNHSLFISNWYKSYNQNLSEVE